MNAKKRPLNRDDWKKWRKGWPYDGDVEDPVYLMERDEIFKENGNGWWWFEGYTKRKHNRDQNRYYIKIKGGDPRNHEWREVGVRDYDEAADDKFFKKTEQQKEQSNGKLL
tara:strand:- start:28 stop:360 length:333 start_codon:yes stop_codon:yes gene_type:complete